MKMLKVDEAQAELKVKTYDQIQEETAWKWGSRAAACFQNVVSGQSDKLAAWTLAEEYYHEAVEHAALSTNDALVRQIRDAISPFQEKAAAAMSGAAPNV
jgi:hypothetical protein